MLESRISGVPVLKDDKLIGIVSEGDLLRRAELGTERHRRAGWSCLPPERVLPVSISKRTARPLGMS